MFPTSGAVAETALIDLTIVVPCLNEVPRIADTLMVVRDAMNEVGCSYEVWVVDDGSTDGTSGTPQEGTRRNIVDAA